MGWAIELKLPLSRAQINFIDPLHSTKFSERRTANAPILGPRKCNHMHFNRGTAGGPRRIIGSPVARPPAKLCFEPGRQLTQHPRLTHHTPAPSPCSHLTRHPPHRVLRLCTSPPLLRSSTSPPQHCTPRQAYACASTQAYSQRAASLCAFF